MRRLPDPIIQSSQANGVHRMKRAQPLNGKVRTYKFPAPSAVFTGNDKPAPKYVPPVSFESKV